MLYEGGHFVPRTQLIAESLSWLDKYLGPVALILSSCTAELMQNLAAAGTNLTAMDAVTAGSRYGALIWVKQPDVEKAARALGAT